MTVHHERRVKGEKANEMQLIHCSLSNFYLHMFQASLCPSSREQDRVLLHMVSTLVVLAVVVWSWVISCV